MTGLLRSKLGQQHEHLALYLFRRQPLLLQFLRQACTLARAVAACISCWFRWASSLL